MNLLPLRSILAPGLPILFLAAAPLAAGAQQLVAPSLPRVHAMPAPGPGTEVPHVYYDVHAERIRAIVTEPWNRIGLASEPCFDNSELSGNPATGTSHWVTPNPGEELVSWGLKFCRQSGLVRNITIAFGCNVDPTIGGAISFALYQGTRGFGVLGTEVFRTTIRGIPSNHGHVPMLLTLEFGLRPLALPDGDIGWGFLQLDGLTGPFLVRAPLRILGTANAMDLYAIGPAPSSQYLGTFNYGDQTCTAATEFTLCASQWIQIEEVPQNQVAGSVVMNGSGVNPVLLHESLPARLGQLWAANLVALDANGNPHRTALFLSNAALAPVTLPSGELLIDPAQQLISPRSGVSAYTAPIPAQIALAGRRIHVQGLVRDPAGAFLTNALRVTVGF